MAREFPIGAVAKQTGLSPDAIRFYEKQRLLPKAARSEGGFRRFTRQDIAHLKYIQQARSLGFSLAEIRDLLDMQGEGKDCARVQARLAEKITEVRQKIRELEELEELLARSLRKCRRALAAPQQPAGEACPIFDDSSSRSASEGESHDH